MQDFRGRSAFVTGGASGIGLAIALALQAEGARVAIADIDRERLAEVGAGAGLVGIALDVADPASWAGAKAAVEDRHGPVDLLINNAGIAADGHDLADITPASFARLVSINLCGVFHGIATFAGGMRERRSGHIVNTGSMAGITPIAGVGGYCASKFGVVGMSEALREEMAPFGVGVSVLCPGMVRTNLNETTTRIAGEQTGKVLFPLDNGMDPARVAELVLDGIRSDRLHIFTHDGWMERVLARHARVIDDYQALAAAPGGKR